MEQEITNPQVVDSKRRITYEFKVVVSYESDTQPVETRRTTLRAGSAKSATVKAASWANRNRPRGRKFRSWVIAIENMSGDF